MAKRCAILILALLPAGLAAPAVLAQEEAQRQQMDSFLSLMRNYLDFSGQWMEMLADERTAIFLAVEGIVEIYEQRGEKAKAIGHLQRVLEKNRGNRVVSSAVHFKLRDLYRETGRSQEALEELDKIIELNSD